MIFIRKIRSLCGAILLLLLIVAFFALFNLSFNLSTHYELSSNELLLLTKSNIRNSNNAPTNALNSSELEFVKLLRYSLELVENNTLTNPEELIQSIEFLNGQHEILNLDRFGRLNSSNVDAVILVQVHNRIEYLKYLVSSLALMKNVDRILLITSHDYVSEPIDKLLKNITFCRVIQIFYPYNTQIFPVTFPGKNPKDCPEKMEKTEAEILKCANWQYPDLYGHYRIPRVAQIKHHWWWKSNYVFDGIMKKYKLNNYVVFLEEDHMVAPDFLHVLKQMIEGKEKFCSDCKVLCLGAYLKSYDSYKSNISNLSIQFWYSSKHNMGMAINSQTWEAIRNCSQYFCTYDDYNWDWTLLSLSVKCLPTKMRALVASAPRAIHIGDCGIHTHRCALHNAAANAQELFNKHADSFFPNNLQVTEIARRMLKPSKPNGGWGDIRDRKLCLMNTYPFASGPFASNFSNFNEITDLVAY